VSQQRFTGVRIVVADCGATRELVAYRPANPRAWYRRGRACDLGVDRATPPNRRDRSSQCANVPRHAGVYALSQRSVDQGFERAGVARAQA